MDNLEKDSQLEDKTYPVFFHLDTKVIKDSKSVTSKIGLSH